MNATKDIFDNSPQQEVLLIALKSKFDDATRALQEVIPSLREMSKEGKHEGVKEKLGPLFQKVALLVPSKEELSRVKSSPRIGQLVLNVYCQTAAAGLASEQVTTKWPKVVPGTGSPTQASYDEGNHLFLCAYLDAINLMQLRYNMDNNTDDSICNWALQFCRLHYFFGMSKCPAMQEFPSDYIMDGATRRFERSVYDSVIDRILAAPTAQQIFGEYQAVQLSNLADSVYDLSANLMKATRCISDNSSFLDGNTDFANILDRIAVSTARVLFDD